MHVVVEIVNIEVSICHFDDLTVDLINGLRHKDGHSKQCIELFIIRPDLG